MAVARALLRDAPILILDEPTEGLDNPSARSLLDAINQLMEGRSVLLITHRIEGLETTDKILLLDNGKITGEDHLAQFLERYPYTKDSAGDMH